jgi:hypothetical protein
LTEPEKASLNTILWGLVIPLIIGIVIVVFPAVLKPALDSWFPPGDPVTGAGASPYAFLTVILTHGLSLMVIMGVPIFLGLNWSKWAGGAAGFVMGTLYYATFAGYNMMWTINNYVYNPNMPIATLDELRAFLASTPNLYRDPSFIGNYIVGAILIGYIAGALNNKSFHFKRKLAASLTAAITVGLFSFVLNYTVSFASWMTQGNPGQALFTAMLPMIILGIIVPIISRITAGGELWHP